LSDSPLLMLTTELVRRRLDYRAYGDNDLGVARAYRHDDRSPSLIGDRMRKFDRSM
jgi:hypothetical protein